MHRNRRLLLDEDVERRIEEYARMCGRTPSEVIREALAELEANSNGARLGSVDESAYDAFRRANAIGCIKGGPPDLSTNPRDMEGFGVVRPVVLDTGLLVAILRERDEHHERCVEALKEAAKPLLTCWPVITEAAWLLRNEPGGVRELFRILASDAVRVVALAEPAVAWIGRFLDQYASSKPQVADAAVLYLAERHGCDTVFTLDRRDFSIYRLSNGTQPRLIP